MLDTQTRNEYQRVRARQLENMRKGYTFATAGKYGQRLGVAGAALNVARAEIALQKAEAEDRIRFCWELDPEPQNALDQDYETAEQEADYRARLEDGRITVWMVRAEVRAQSCPTCGQSLEDVEIEDLWTAAPGMDSLGCIDVEDNDDGRAHRREVERDLAAEAGVID